MTDAAPLAAMAPAAPEVASRARAVAGRYGELAEDDYRARWEAVAALAGLPSADAVVLLGRVLTTPVPPERSSSPHEFSTVEEEVGIRLAAVRALLAVRTAGAAGAVDALVSGALQAPSYTVRQACMEAVADAAAEPDRLRLWRLLEETGATTLLATWRHSGRRVPPGATALPAAASALPPAPPGAADQGRDRDDEALRLLPPAAARQHPRSA